ncbi:MULTISPECIES: RNA-binding domain-containing protein [unclassified Corynebacterium]|uniref:RNA-binding domain-containing protein n=1 Tax=unclassified Corynebacterium TaxID=2624378 RepID=UPI0008FB07F7|nr:MULTISPECIES: RNA-binding domain-containing protein [unclassified Corynebacterium]MCQ4612629.1 putative DNA binding domain-containing protein [Corynebacterium sp. CCUG 51687]OIR43546.1 DNA-binding protein [Corynebacterium sp. NML120713]
MNTAVKVDELLTRPEDQWFERKSFRIKPKDLAKAIIAFANAEGGVIAVGITDRQFDGLPSARQDNDLRQSAFDHTDPTVRVEIESLRIDDATSVYLFHILPSERVHYSNSGECFLRIGDETKQLGPDGILELRYLKGEQQFDAIVPPRAEPGDLDMAQVERYAEAIGSASAQDALRARNLIDRAGNPRTAALLLFGKHPQEFFPNAHVRVVQFNDIDRLPGHGQQILYDERFDGTLPEQIQQARTAISKILPKVRRLVGSGLFEEEDLIPPDVWLEGLVNAVIHRSYSMAGDHVRFEIYPDRVEVSSPGRFPGLVDPSKPEAIARFARNPLIARGTAELRIGQELGEGIRRMIAGMRKAGFADPVYRQTSGSVVLTLKAVQRLDESLRADLPRYSTEVLAALQASPHPLSTGQVANALHLSNPPVRRALQALRDAGLVQWNGSGLRDPRATWSAVSPLRY